MAIKRYKPTTPGRRGMTVTDYSGLSKVAPEKSLLEPVKKHSGRNNTGRITVRHHGGGNRRKYRVIDFKREKLDVGKHYRSLVFIDELPREPSLAFVDTLHRDKAVANVHGYWVKAYHVA